MKMEEISKAMGRSWNSIIEELAQNAIIHHEEIVLGMYPTSDALADFWIDQVAGEGIEWDESWTETILNACNIIITTLEAATS